MARTKGEEVEFDFAAAVGKPASGLQEHLTSWIKEKTGVTFNTKKEESAFDLGVKLTVQLRMRHQASEENQERLAEEVAAREEREAEKAEKPKAEPEEKPAKKAAAKKAAPAPAAEEKPTPAKRGGRRPKPATADQPF